MKRFMSILIATIMILTMFTVPTYAEDLYEGDFYININGGSEKVVISWDEFYGAELYRVSIDTDYDYYCIDEIITGTSYNWVPDASVSPNVVFDITVYAYNSNGELIAQSNVVQTYIVVMMCDNFGVYGDVDNDQMITVMDATMVQRYLARAQDLNVMQKQMGDVDSDGKLSALDSTYIQQTCSYIYDSRNRAGYSAMVGWVEYEVHFDKWWET